MDEAGELTQIYFDTSKGRALEFKGTNASEDDEQVEVLEAPVNHFIYGISQEKAYGPIVDFQTAQLPLKSQNSDGYFARHRDEAGLRCEFRDSLFIPQEKDSLTSDPQVLAKGACHAPTWRR